MVIRRFDIEAGGSEFAFRPETESMIAFWLNKYPEGKQASAVIPLLWLAQKDNNGWLSEPAMRVVADRLKMPWIRVYEVATFYTMFRLKPVGKYHVQLCGTTPCMLRGANDLKDICRQKIGSIGEPTKDGKFSWEEVECLGACVNAPIVQINDDYYEDLTERTFAILLGDLDKDVEVKPGTQINRLNSEAFGGSETLRDESLFNGSRNNLKSLPNTNSSEVTADA